VRQTCKCPWKTKIKDKYKGRCFYTPALHGEELTRRNLLGCLNLLEGLLRFGFGVLHALEGLSKLGLLSLRVTLQGLILLDEILELLLDLADPGLVLLARGAFLGRFVLGLGKRLLEGCHLGRGP